MVARSSALRATALPALILAIILIGGALRLDSATASLGMRLWTGALWVLVSGLVWRSIRRASTGQFATDLVATLAIVTAVLLHQPLAGLIVVLMQTGGEALERHARGRASEALHALEDAAPHIAHRMAGDDVVDIIG